MPVTPLAGTPSGYPYDPNRPIVNQEKLQNDSLVPYWFIVFIAGGLCWYAGVRFLFVPLYKNIFH